MSKVAIKGADTGTGVFTLESPATNTDRTLTLPDEAGTVLTSASDLTGVTGVPNPLTSGTAVASTSGTAIDFTGIPSWVKRITVMFSGVSTTGTNPYQIQLGAGSVDAASYNTSCTSIQGAAASSQSGTTGFYITVEANMGAASTLYGSVIFSLISGNTWAGLGSLSRAGGDNTMFFAAGTKALSGTLDRLRITTTAGSQTFDAGSINIMYE